MRRYLEKSQNRLVDLLFPRAEKREVFLRGMPADLPGAEVRIREKGQRFSTVDSGWVFWEDAHKRARLLRLGAKRPHRRKKVRS